MAIRIGSDSDDFFPSQFGNDLFIARAGFDTIQTGGGIDIVLAGAGEDKITSGNGLKFVVGGSSVDTFATEDGVEGQSVILDFEDGSDLIDVRSFGVTELSDLTIVNTVFGVNVVIGAYTYSLFRFEGDLDASDFIFAPSTELIDFEDLNSNLDIQDIVLIDRDYKGFEWSQFSLVQLELFNGERGYDATSGTHLIMSNRDEAAIRNKGQFDDLFDLDQAFMGAVFRNGLEVTASAFVDDQLQGQQKFTLNTTGAELIKFDDEIFGAIDEVVFTTEGGEPAPGLDGTSSLFYIDDLIIG